MRTVKMENFQYPLSDRTRCNGRATNSASPTSRAFSIPYRIELAVTANETN